MTQYLSSDNTEILEDVLNNFMTDIAIQISLNEIETNIDSNQISVRQIETKCPLIYIETNIECSICMKNVEVGSKMRKLPCEHFFCRKCIDAWFMNGKNTCPICRKIIHFHNM